LRVLHVDTEAGFRGGQRQVLLLCGGLRERGVEATLLAREGGELARAAAAQGIAVTCVRQGVPWDPRPVRRLRWLLRRTPVDLVHAHASHAHGAAVAALATIPAPARPPLVVSRRVDFPLHGPLARRIKYGPLVRCFLAVSRAVAGVLEEGGVPPDRVRVVHSGVPPLPPPDRGRDEVRRALGVAPDRPLLLTTAALVDHKDHATAIRAVARCRAHVRLVIAGEGPLRAALDRLIEAEGVGDRVQLLGQREDVPDLLAAADLYLASSHLEGLCTALMDAGRAGLAVVGTSAGGIPEVVRDGETGLLAPPRDPAALAARVDRLVQDPPLRERLGRAAAARVEQAFSVDRMVAGTVQAYREVLGA